MLTRFIAAVGAFAVDGVTVFFSLAKNVSIDRRWRIFFRVVGGATVAKNVWIFHFARTVT